MFMTRAFPMRVARVETLALALGLGALAACGGDGGTTKAKVGYLSIQTKADGGGDSFEGRSCLTTACHGIKGGKTGDPTAKFKVTLDAGTPAEAMANYQSLLATSTAKGKVVDVANVDASLLLSYLLTNDHSGGLIFRTKQDAFYVKIHDWIAAGAPFDAPK